MPDSDAINNSYQIEEEFHINRWRYFSNCLPSPTHRSEPPGKCKHYTEEEILVYKLKHYQSPFQNLTD